MIDTSRPLLEKEMEVLQDWFDRLYGPRKAKLKIYHKWNNEKRREEYILDLFFEATSRSLPFAIPYEFLEQIDYRVSLKQRWVSEMQKKIMEVLK